MFFIRLLSHYRFKSNELLLELKTGQQCSIHCRSITLVQTLPIQSQLKILMDDIVLSNGERRNVKCIFDTECQQPNANNLK